MTESYFEQPSGNFLSSHQCDDQISIVAFSDTKLDYSEECVSLATEPSHQAIKPSNTATRPSHETNVSQSPKEVQPNGAASNNPSTSLYNPDSAQSSWEPQKELSFFLEKQFRRKLTDDQVCEILDNYNVPSVDCLITPTLDPSIVNHISPSQTKKFMKDRDKEMAVVQRALLNTTGPLCSLHDALSSGTQIPAEESKSIVQQTLCLLMSKGG